MLNTFNFDNKVVRVIVGDDGEPRWVAKDIANILGYSANSNPTRLFASVPEGWRGLHLIHTSSGNQEMVVLTEQGLYFFLNRSDKPTAIPFQKWIAGEVIPSIRKTGQYSAIPQQMPMSQLQIAKQMIIALEEQQSQLAAVTHRIDVLETKNQGMDMAYTPLPDPGKEVPKLSKRDYINMSVRGYCKENDHDYQAAYRRLYTEFKYRYHIDLLARKSDKETALDVAVRLGDAVLDDLYALSILLFGERIQ